jgi:MraZ protein
VVKNGFMFIGEYTHSVDSKNRLFVPTKFQKDLKQGIVVTRGLDSCLFVFTLKAWEEIATKLKSMPLTNQNSRAFARLMLAGAMEVKLDKQGRILIPQYLKEFASLDKETVLAGLFDRIEIWNKESWEKYKKQTEKDSNKIAENLTELGI